VSFAVTFAFGEVLDDCEELTFRRNDDDGVVDDQTASSLGLK
jgi:hypothetical protein